MMVAASGRELTAVAVIILTMNQKDTTLRCLSSLLAGETRPRVVLWDNGSQDGTVAAVREAFPDVLVHHHPGNLGVASGRNAAAQLAVDTFSPKYLLFLDNDMEAEPDFVGELLRPLAEEPALGQTQAKLRFMDDRQRLNDGGGARIDFLRWRVRPVGFGELDRGQYDEPRRCVSCGGAMMVRTELFQQLGGFDPSFNPSGPEDLDFSLRLAATGYHALYVPTAVAYHAVNHTFGKGYTEEYARNKARVWFKFMRRHASFLQQAGFLLLGLPYIGTRVILRESRRGNVRAVRGLVRGAVDLLRPRTAGR